MRRRRLFTTLAAVSFLIVAMDAAEADPVTFTFTGACVSGGGEGCGAFGLSEGGVVSGRLVLDDTVAGSGQRLILSPSTVDFEFSFSFGDLVVSNANLGGAAFEVFFLPPDASELNALSAPLPPGPYRDGSRFLLLGPSRRVDATQIFAVFRSEAFATGAWLRQEDLAPVPEPTTLGLMACGLTTLALRRRRKV